MDLLYSLLGGTLVAVVLAYAGALAGGRAFYFVGLGCACLAFAVGSVLNVAFGQLMVGAPGLVVAAISPALEEPLRTAAIFRGLPRSRTPSQWMSFAAGYALLESVVKFFDSVVLVSQRAGDTAELAASMSVPFVPFALHMFLGVLAMRMRASSVNAILVLLVLFALHTAHNASILIVPRPDAGSHLLLEILVRSLVFLALTICLARSPTRAAI